MTNRRNYLETHTTTQEVRTDLGPEVITESSAAQYANVVSLHSVPLMEPATIGSAAKLGYDFAKRGRVRPLQPI